MCLHWSFGKNIQVKLFYISVYATYRVDAWYSVKSKVFEVQQNSDYTYFSLSPLPVCPNSTMLKFSILPSDVLWQYSEVFKSKGLGPNWLNCRNLDSLLLVLPR